MIGNYIFGSHAVLLVYDITNYQVGAKSGALTETRRSIMCSDAPSGVVMSCDDTDRGSAFRVRVCSSVSAQSFQNLEDWFALVKQTFKDKPMPLIVRRCRCGRRESLTVHGRTLLHFSFPAVRCVSSSQRLFRAW